MYSIMYLDVIVIQIAIRSRNYDVTMKPKYHQKNGSYPAYLFPNIKGGWQNPTYEGATYCQSTYYFRTLLEEIGTGSPNSYTLHALRSYYTTAANQLGFSKEKRSTLGRWVSSGNMADHYDRSACTTELKLRNNVSKVIREDNW